jgi:hypothetical protein
MEEMSDAAPEKRSGTIVDSGYSCLNFVFAKKMKHQMASANPAIRDILAMLITQANDVRTCLSICI